MDMQSWKLSVQTMTKDRHILQAISEDRDAQGSSIFKGKQECKETEEKQSTALPVNSSRAFFWLYIIEWSGMCSVEKRKSQM